jgi:chaperone modulatory protein CbpM
MTKEITEVLDEHYELSLTEMEQLSGLTTDELQLLVECQALSPTAAIETDPSLAHVRFSAQCLTVARSAARLRSDFDLDQNALAVTLRLLKRIDDLETELLALRAQTPLCQ